MGVQLLNADKRITVKDSDLPDVTGGDPDTTYTVRQLAPEESRAISRKHTTDLRRGGEKVNSMAIMDELIDRALVAWTGVLLDGEPAECTPANKLLLDGPRKLALLEIAGSNQMAKEEAKAASFPRAQ